MTALVAPPWSVISPSGFLVRSPLGTEVLMILASLNCWSVDAPSL